MNKVYVVMLEWVYESDQIDSIYDTEEKAIVRKQEIESERYKPDFVGVYTYEVE